MNELMVDAIRRKIDEAMASPMGADMALDSLNGQLDAIGRGIMASELTRLYLAALGPRRRAKFSLGEMNSNEVLAAANTNP